MSPVRPEPTLAPGGQRIDGHLADVVPVTGVARARVAEANDDPRAHRLRLLTRGLPRHRRPVTVQQVAQAQVTPPRRTRQRPGPPRSARRPRRPRAPPRPRPPRAPRSAERRWRR